MEREGTGGEGRAPGGGSCWGPGRTGPFPGGGGRGKEAAGGRRQRAAPPPLAPRTPPPSGHPAPQDTPAPGTPLPRCRRPGPRPPRGCAGAERSPPSRRLSPARSPQTRPGQRARVIGRPRSRDAHASRRLLLERRSRPRGRGVGGALRRARSGPAASYLPPAAGSGGAAHRPGPRGPLAAPAAFACHAQPPAVLIGCAGPSRGPLPFLPPPPQPPPPACPRPGPPPRVQGAGCGAARPFPGLAGGARSGRGAERSAAPAAVKLPRDARRQRAADWPAPPADALPPCCRCRRRPSPAVARGKRARPGGGGQGAQNGGRGRPQGARAAPPHAPRGRAAEPAAPEPRGLWKPRVCAPRKAGGNGRCLP